MALAVYPLAEILVASDHSKDINHPFDWVKIKIRGKIFRLNFQLFLILSIVLGDGKDTYFWEEQWVGDSPLYASFPRLYHLSSLKN